MSDLRFAFRQLLKNPGFTAVAVLTLTLGIGLTAIFFSFADALLFRSLPVPEPERLVQLEKFRKDGSSGESFPFPAYRRLRDEAKATFSGLAAFSNIRPGTMMENGNPSEVSVMLASGDFHQTLGLIPRLGRLLKPEDDGQNGDEPVAVISHSLWISRFEGDSLVVGKPIQVNGTAYTVIGVTPANFGGVRVGEDPSVTVPIKMLSAIEGQPREVDTWGNWWLRILARRQPAISLAAAESAVAGLWRNVLQEQVSSVPPSWQAEARKTAAEETLRLNPAAAGAASVSRQQWRDRVLACLGLVTLVMLLCCVNVAGLLLARFSQRQREIGIRMALGSGRGRIISGFVAEGMLLAICGGLGGLLLTKWAAPVILSFAGDYSGGVALPVSLDLRTVAFVSGLTLLACLIAAVAPALAATRNTSSDLIRAQADVRRGLFALPRLLVGIQMALAFAVVVTAGLFLRTLANLSSRETGYRSAESLMFAVRPDQRGMDSGRLAETYVAIQNRLNELPGAEAACFLDVRPISGEANRSQAEVARMPKDMDREVGIVNSGPHVAQALGLALLRGRDLATSDSSGSGKAALISAAMASHFFGDTSPLGRQVRANGTDWQVVGVVGDVEPSSPGLNQRRVMYPAWLQAPQRQGMTFVVKFRQAAPGSALQIRRTLASIDATLPALQLRSFSAEAAVRYGRERLLAGMAGALGSAGLLLAGLGLFGVQSYLVGRRIREFGIRMALGAKRNQIVSHILKEGQAVTLCGAAIGLALSFCIGTMLAGQLYGITPFDPLNALFSLTVLQLAAVVACFLPARRASRVDPMVALRSE